MVAYAVDDIHVHRVSRWALKLNPSKREIIECSLAASHDAFQVIHSPGRMQRLLFWVHLFWRARPWMTSAGQVRGIGQGNDSLVQLLDAHDALILLRAAVGHPTIMNVIRASPLALVMRSWSTSTRCTIQGFPKIVNCELTDLSWIQSGVHHTGWWSWSCEVVASLASSAFWHRLQQFWISRTP